MPPSSQWIVGSATGPTLRSGHSRRAFADTCRATALAFLDGAARGWGKRELVEWLLGTYRAVSFRPALKLALALDDDEARGDARAIRPGVVEELVALVRIAVCTTLSELQRGDTAAVTLAVREGRVASCAARDGGLWIPVDRPGFRLESRVTSLFVVDYLLRPRSYERDLAVCSLCERVWFAPMLGCECDVAGAAEPVLELSQRWLCPARVG